jgi:endonuclease/exonuclease/phosphatase (EEP) superfamily protein YafD
LREDVLFSSTPASSEIPETVIARPVAGSIAPPVAEDEPPRVRVSRLGRALIPVVSALWLAWVIGQVLRDRTWLTGLCFYIPSVAVAAIAAAFAIGCLGVRAYRRALGALLLAVPPLVMIVAVENRWVRTVVPAPGRSMLKVVHWNIGYAIYGWQRVRGAIMSERADLVVISEVPGGATANFLVSELGTGYTGLRLSSMAVLATGPLRNPRRWIDDGELRAYSVTWESREGPVEVLAVDLASDPLMARDPVLQRLTALIEQVHPDLVVGDFNAPRRSRALSPLPAGYVHAYDAVGCGWSATWPLPCPVLAIDQCLVGARLRPVRYDLVTTGASDHRQQVLEFRVRSDATGPRGARPSGADDHW